MEPSRGIRCAQTNVQLYRQLLDAGWETEDLRRARAGYELATELFAGRFRPMGKPFVCHLVGVASLLESFGAPRPTVLAGLLHSAYPQGDFGTGRNRVGKGERDRVRAAIGPEAERLVAGYAAWKDGGLAAIEELAEGGDADHEAAREVLLIELLDTLEEHQDQGIAFCRKAPPEERYSGPAGGLEIADLIERPDVAEWLRRASAQVVEARVPAVLVADRRSSFTLGAAPRTGSWVLGRARTALRRAKAGLARNPA